MKCANCPAEAIYSLVEPRVSPVHYCGRCLPAHLRVLASAGRLPLTTGTQGTTPEVTVPVVEPVAAVETTAPKRRKRARTATPTATTEEISAVELEAAINDGYSSTAKDGDNDGLVQDGTPFERPEGEILVGYSEESTEEEV